MKQKLVIIGNGMAPGRMLENLLEDAPEAYDVTIFNADTVIDKATFQNPHQYPEGIEYVIVNGTIVLDHGRHLGAKPGKVLFGKGRK